MKNGHRLAASGAAEGILVTEPRSQPWAALCETIREVSSPVRVWEVAPVTRTETISPGWVL